MAFLCIDIGGTNTLVGVGNGDFEVVEKLQSERFLNDIEGSLREILDKSQAKKVDQVAVAAAGPIDRERGVFFPPNIDRDEIDLKTPLSNFGEVQMINDCTSAVIGEYVYGNHDVENIVYLTISSGIGAGIIMGGNVIEGANGNFGEIGHMEIAENGVKCGCGCYGHWEAYCSGNNLPRMAQYLTGEEFEDARHLFEEAKNDNENAIEAMDKMHEYNARAFGNMVNLFDPDKIVVGGAVALNHPSLVVDPMEKVVEEKVMTKVPSIEVCSLDERSVIHGLRAVCNGF